MNATIITILKVILVIYDCVAKISWLKITDIYFLIVFVGCRDLKARLGKNSLLARSCGCW